ncbi:uncharacterized protein [Lolium perenne]|uniref:uncharacterized protein n=1 Tax=Lolium perenne TaxID=4522 RepID=UPI003A991921
MWQEEHFSRRKRAERLMSEFREALSDCDLHDIGFIGTPWTFDNKQKGDRNVKVRLDRAVASPEWSLRFPNTRLRHIISSRSDHLPLLLTEDESAEFSPGNYMRRYEVFWEREPSLASAVEEAWSRRIPTQDLGGISYTLKDIMSSLYRWKAANIKPLPKEIDKRRLLMEELISRMDSDSEAEKTRLAREMDELLYREEIAWMQRSRVAWLKEGDRNTKYFHRQASKRNWKNKIRSLRRTDGSFTHDKEEMEAMATSFYQNLYTRYDNVDPNIIIEEVQHCVDDHMNDGLCKHFSEEEISDALFQIGPLKAPGPDGFPTHFLQCNWGLFRDEVVKVVQFFLLQE